MAGQPDKRDRETAERGQEIEKSGRKEEAKDPSIKSDPRVNETTKERGSREVSEPTRSVNKRDARSMSEARIVGVPQGKITHRVNGRMVPVIRAVDLLLEKRTNQETSKKEHPPGQEILQMENAAGDHVPRRERNPGCVAPERENK